VTFTAILAEEPAPAKEQPQVPFFANPLFLVLMFGLFFLVVMLPAQRRQKREAAAMMAALKAGTKVVTSSGIYGTIVKIKDGEDEVVIKSEDSRLKITRSVITRVLGEDADTKG
jgi:preprotein translocase subunit YajC